MFKVNVPFLNRDDLNEVVSRTILKTPVQVEPVLNGERILELGAILDKVVVADPIRDYAVRLTLGTHPDTEYATENIKKFVRWGGSPRSAQALVKAGRVRAISGGRAHLAFEDIRHFAVEVFQHRVLLNYDGQAENTNVADLVVELLNHVPEEP